MARITLEELAAMGREVRRRADDVSEDLALLGELLALHARGHQGLC